MIIRLTHKLAKKLHEELTPALPLSKDPLLDWHATVLRAERTQYILLMNSVSRYSIAFPSRGIMNLTGFLQQALSVLQDTMAADGLDIYPTRIEPHTRCISVCKSLNSSALTAMNHMAYFASRYFARPDLAKSVARRMLNEVPCNPFDWRTPCEFIQAIASLPNS